MKHTTSGRAAISILFIMSLILLAEGNVPGTDWTEGPQPGDVYWEYVHVPKNPNSGKDAYITPRYAWGKKWTIDVPDLTNATKAEMSFEFWGGHIGTSRQRVVVNGHTEAPVYWELPKKVPTGKPNCYFRTCHANSATKVPLAHLKKGTNSFEFFHNEQICYAFFPNTWGYSAILRVYYDPAKKAHATGTITSPASGSTIGESAPVVLGNTKGTIKQVDFIGSYRDFDWEGNGLFEQWHYQRKKGKFANHIGKGFGPPYKATWSTKWLPDQPKGIKIMARIKDANGICHMTQAVENIRLKRSYSVKLFEASLVPENFAVRVKRTKNCRIDYSQSLKGAIEAKLYLSTWGAYHKNEPGTIIKLNGNLVKQKFGKFHAYSMDIFPVKLSALQNGKTFADFTIHSATEHHMAEVNWPGPVLMVKYGSPDTTFDTTAAISNEHGRDFEIAESRFGTRIHNMDLWRTEEGLAFSVPWKGDFHFELFDVHGRTIKSIRGSGPAVHPVHSRSISHGAYVGRLSAGGQTMLRRLIVTPDIR